MSSTRQLNTTSLNWNISAQQIKSLYNTNLTLDASGNSNILVKTNNSLKTTIGTNIDPSNSNYTQFCALTIGNQSDFSSNCGVNAYGTYYSNGVSALKIPADTSNNRPPGQSGYIRYNTTINTIEFWNNSLNSWNVFDLQPTLISIQPSTVVLPNYDISLIGLNFTSGSTVQFIDSSLGTIYNSPVVTFISSSKVLARTPSTALPQVSYPYSVKITSSTSLNSTLSNILFTGSQPSFISPPGNIGTIWDITRNNGDYTLLPVTATDPDTGDIITYSITTGALPTGLSLNSSTGAITGTATAVGADTTFTFTILASTPSSLASPTRQFNILVKAPVTQTFSYTGASQTFSIPTGLPRIRATLWGAGGGAYAGSPAGVEGAGGPGGFTQSIFNIISGESTLTIVVGGGGSANATAGYGGGGNGANGGSGGGGSSFVLSGNISTPFSDELIAGSYTNNKANNSILDLSGAIGIIVVSGGGGGAGWVVTNNLNGGPGGGIIAGNSYNGPSPPTGGTQSAGGGTAGNYSVNGSKCKGGYVSNNASNGGSGGGGGGWFGGGCYQTSSGGSSNSAGGGGSGFAGYTDGSNPFSSPTVLTGTTVGSYPNSFASASTRTNGSRIYYSAYIYRIADLGSGPISSTTSPPEVSNIYYSAGIGTGAARASNLPGGNGKVVLNY